MKFARNKHINSEKQNNEPITQSHLHDEEWLGFWQCNTSVAALCPSHYLFVKKTLHWLQLHISLNVIIHHPLTCVFHAGLGQTVIHTLFVYDKSLHCVKIWLKPVKTSIGVAAFNIYSLETLA